MRTRHSHLADSNHCVAQEDTPLHADAADPSRVITKSTARRLTKQIAYVLRYRYGIGQHGPNKDVVVVMSSGQPLLPMVFYGVIAAGGVYSAASYASTVADLSHQVTEGSCGLVICSRDCEDVVKASAKNCGLSTDRLLRIESAPDWNLVNLGSGAPCQLEPELDWRRITDQTVLEESVICLLYSSGTTGPPKGVLISHLNMVAEGTIPLRMILEYEDRARTAGGYIAPYRTLAHLPAAHIAGAQGYFVNPFLRGGITYWMPKFEFEKFLEYNKKYQISFFFTVPPIYLLIAKHPAVTDQFDHLQHAVSGAAPLGKELQHAASRKLGKGKTFISQTWGLTETTGSATLLQKDEMDDTGSVSKIMPNISIRVIDDEGVDVKPGEAGELCCKGPIITKGYYKRPDATAAAFFEDGWFRTGDIGLVKDSLVYIVDRKKELIKYKGLQVAPAELEGLLLSHPLIADAAVIGVPGEGTELPRAYIVADQAKISGAEVVAYVKANVASHKQLRGGVVFIDSIPKSASGKILRKDLRICAQKSMTAKL
ncbi:MAG: hypothetical protein Q9227_000036 [Pyrenula ochraceoflavens]